MDVKSTSPTQSATEPIELAPVLSLDASQARAVQSADDTDPIELVRERLGIVEGLSDVSIAASLAAISTRATDRERWLAAFASPLGHWLAARGGDLNAAIAIVIAIAPRADT